MVKIASRGRPVCSVQAAVLFGSQCPACSAGDCRSFWFPCLLDEGRLEQGRAVLSVLLARDPGEQDILLLLSATPVELAKLRRSEEDRQAQKKRELDLARNSL
jgi:hypothetical protein